MKGLLGKTGKILAALALVYVFALTGIYVFQRNLLYFPNHTYVSPEAAFPKTGFAEFPVRTEDELDLKGWYVPAKAQGLTLVYFHGNADSLETAAPLAQPFIDAGYGYLIVEYRGYSNMPGSPSEEGLYADARAFVKKLIETGVKENDIVLIAHSLGTGVATEMAGEFGVRGMILMTPFLSIPEMAEVRFPFIPARQMTRDKFDNASKISSLHLPLLIAASGKDIVVPTEQEKALYELANEPKRLYYSQQSGHNNLFNNGFYPICLDWLRKL